MVFIDPAIAGFIPEIPRIANQVILVWTRGGDAMSRDVKRTVAQFLNGVALAVLAAGAIGPVAMANAMLPSVVIAVAISLCLHGLALLVSAK